MLCECADACVRWFVPVCLCALVRACVPVCYVSVVHVLFFAMHTSIVMLFFPNFLFSLYSCSREYDTNITHLTGIWRVESPIQFATEGTGDKRVGRMCIRILTPCHRTDTWRGNICDLQHWSRCYRFNENGS